MRLFLLLCSIFASGTYAFDHSYQDWSEILKQYTVIKKKQVYVDYKVLKFSPAKLDKFLSRLERLNKKAFDQFSQNEQLAFWINAYNAFTFRLVVKHYPVESIKDIGWFFSTPWKIDFINLFGKQMSLDDIEHGIIRKDFKEARIHFALNCASIGCPSLHQEAFVAEKLEEQLSLITEKFLKNTRKNVISKKAIYISKIFDWFEEDFVKYHGSVEKFVGKALGMGNSLEGRKVKYMEYSWKLNELSGQKKVEKK